MRANLDQDGGLNMAEAQMTSLARGLDELTVEVARSGELPAPGSGAVLDVHATRLEIDGWVLRRPHPQGLPGRGGERPASWRTGPPGTSTRTVAARRRGLTSTGQWRTSARSPLRDRHTTL